jgi:hypothetical protein
VQRFRKLLRVTENATEIIMHLASTGSLQSWLDVRRPKFLEENEDEWYGVGVVYPPVPVIANLLGAATKQPVSADLQPAALILVSLHSQQTLWYPGVFYDSVEPEKKGADRRGACNKFNLAYGVYP